MTFSKPGGIVGRVLFCGVTLFAPTRSRTFASLAVALVTLGGTAGCTTPAPPDAALQRLLDASKLTTVDRTDGTKQVKYGDWPLYYFAGDSKAGDTNGQGVATKWYVVDATGAMIK